MTVWVPIVAALEVYTDIKPVIESIVSSVALRAVVAETTVLTMEYYRAPQYWVPVASPLT